MRGVSSQVNEKENLIVVAVAPDFGIATVIRSLLESEAVVVLGLSTSANVSIAGAVPGYKIDVLKKDEMRARELLRSNSFERYLVE